MAAPEGRNRGDARGCKPGHIINIGPVQARFEEPGGYRISKKAEKNDRPESSAKPGAKPKRLQIGPRPGMARIGGDPQYIANAVRCILEAPIEIDIQELVVRPPISTSA